MHTFLQGWNTYILFKIFILTTEFCWYRLYVQRTLVRALGYKQQNSPQLPQLYSLDCIGYYTEYLKGLDN